MATAESITGGLVAHRLTQVPSRQQRRRPRRRRGVSESRRRSACSACPRELIERHTAVSWRGGRGDGRRAIRERLDVDLAISTTGNAGPTGDPVGLVYVGLATREGVVSSTTFNWFGSRSEIQSRVAKMALNRLRLHLESRRG